MKNLILILSFSLFLFGCDDDEKTVLNTSQANNGMYSVTFYTLEGACPDSFGSTFDVYLDTIYGLEGGDVVVNGDIDSAIGIVALASSDELEATSMQGAISKRDEFHGSWENSSCHGYYTGNFVRDLNLEEIYYYQSLN
jgi:hypothetical protein